MSDFTFRPAVRERVSLLIGLAGASGSGKTYSAHRLARGLSPEGKIVGVDTEAGRMLHYADEFKFLHGDMRPPFEPERYVEAIFAAEQTGAEVVIVDSMSHEWAGEGGCQDMQEVVARRMATRNGKFDPSRYEAMSAPAWREPKIRHKRMVSRLLQCRAHLIFCLRAEEKIKFVKVADENGKEITKIVQAGWMPISEKGFISEMTLSFTLAPETPGMPRFDLPNKLQRQHRPFFPEGREIGEEAGAALRGWASGGAAPEIREPRELERDRKPSFLDRVRDRLDRALTEDDVHAVENNDAVKRALENAPQDVRDQLNAMLRSALERVEQDVAA